MLRAAFLPWPTAAVTVRSPGAMSPPAKMPGRPVIMPASTVTMPSAANDDARHACAGTPLSVCWPSARTTEFGRQRFELAGRLRAALFVQPHHLDGEFALADVLDRAEPLDLDAFRQRLVGFERLRAACGRGRDGRR